MTSSDYRKLSALLSAMKDGAREAFADVYAMYEKKVYFLCCKILKSKGDAKKLTIDIFNYAYLQLLNFDDAAGFEKWLYSVVFSKCRHFLTENRPEVFGDYTDTDSPDGEQVDIMLVQDADEMMNYPDGIDVSVDMMNTVDSILTELPHKLRTAVLLYFFCGFDCDEIAKIEQISYACVKNRLFKARIRLGTEEHKFTEIGYAVEGMVIFFPDVLSVMASSIVVPGEMAAGVTARTGVNCMMQTRKEKPVVPEEAPKPAVSDTQNTVVIRTPVQQKPANTGVSQPTKYGTQPPKKAEPHQEMSPAVKVFMAIVALLVIIGGTIAVTLVIQGNKSSDSLTGEVENFDNNIVPTTIEITTKNDSAAETTAAETTTEATTVTTTEATTVATTEATTEATTQAPVTTTAETTVSPVVPDEGAENQGDAGAENGEE